MSACFRPCENCLRIFTSDNLSLEMVMFMQVLMDLYLCRACADRNMMLGVSCILGVAVVPNSGRRIPRLPSLEEQERKME